MFENARARFAKLEEDHEAVRSVKQHVEKYQVVYATIGGSALTLVAVKLFGKPQVIVKGASELPAVINNTPIFNNTPVIAPVMNNIGNVVENGGHCTKIVQRLSDKEIFEKAGDAAFDIAQGHGITLDRARWMLSKHLNGHLDDVFGETFKTIGLSTTG